MLSWFRFFPPEAPVEYSLAIHLTSREELTRDAHKTVFVTVQGPEHVFLLEDEFEFHAALIQPEIEWTEFTRIRINLREVGSTEARGPYNLELLKHGPRTLATLEYLWNPEVERFELREQLEPGAIWTPGSTKRELTLFFDPQVETNDGRSAVSSRWGFPSPQLLRPR